MNGYYTTGEFAKKANVSIRTIQYYDKQNVLKPAQTSEAGYRLYTDSDFAKLQKILSLKYLGFSLDEIRSITVNDEDQDYLNESIAMQQRLIRRRIEQLQLVEKALEETRNMIREDPAIDWNRILHLIHITNMEKSLVEQYKNTANINIRIDLHQKYATNPVGWFPWLYQMISPQSGTEILEIGCGNGELWRGSLKRLPEDLHICLTDISEGMVQDVRNLLQEVPVFSFEVMDGQDIAKDAECFDQVIANHVLFYLKSLDEGLQEITRVLKSGGTFFCTTYGRSHMKEISQLVKEFDSRIALSDINLYEIFGLEDGDQILNRYFTQVELIPFEDELKVNDAGPLMEYILSCHGNQQEYLSDHYPEFKTFLEKKIQKKGYITITKQAGLFICRK
ncbi:MAG: MerR family transcriptional regulator [Lachnospiraceae bacterium]